MSKFNLQTIKNANRAAQAHVSKAVATTGHAIVNGVANGHAKGVEYVAIVTDYVNNHKWLIKADTDEGALSKAKEFSKTLTRASIKVLAVPVAYSAGLFWGFLTGVASTFKDAYKASDAEVQAVEKAAQEIIAVVEEASK